MRSWRSRKHREPCFIPEPPTLSATLALSWRTTSELDSRNDSPDSPAHLISHRSRAVRTVRRSAFVSAGALVMCAVATCGDRDSVAEPDYPTWTTMPEFRFSADPDHDVSLSQVPYLRADPVRNRVFVIDLLDKPVTA